MGRMLQNQKNNVHKCADPVYTHEKHTEHMAWQTFHHQLYMMIVEFNSRLLAKRPYILNQGTTTLAA